MRPPRLYLMLFKVLASHFLRMDLVGYAYIKILSIFCSKFHILVITLRFTFGVHLWNVRCHGL